MLKKPLQGMALTPASKGNALLSVLLSAHLIALIGAVLSVSLSALLSALELL